MGCLVSRSDSAVEYGFDLAKQFGAIPEVLYVVDDRIQELTFADESEEILENVEETGRRTLSRIVEREPDLDIRQELRYGVPYEEILTYSKERDIDLVIVGSSAGADSQLRSTAERVITPAGAPVLEVPGPKTTADVSPPSEMENIVVPLDGSNAAERAAEHALEFAEWVDATIHGVYVIDTTVYDLEDAPRSIVGLLREGGEKTINELAQQADEADIPYKGSIKRGRPAREILATADTVEADLVVMGSRGRSGLPEHLLGSTTRRIVSDGSRPVLSVR